MEQLFKSMMIFLSTDNVTTSDVQKLRERVEEASATYDNLKEHLGGIVSTLTQIERSEADLSVTIKDILILGRFIEDLVKHIDSKRDTRRLLLRRIFSEMKPLSNLEFSARDDDEDVELTYFTTRRTFDAYYHKHLKLITEEFNKLQEKYREYLTRKDKGFSDLKERIAAIIGD